jgi:hypothetical protein
MLMLDSGAFSVWTRGAEVDLAAYVDFCVRHPAVDHFVNLDVIPGVPGTRPSRQQVRAACVASWNNYLRMTDALPKSKVIPVFHQHDPVSWLHSYLDKGAAYVGISPANDSPVSERLRWLRTLRPVLFDGAGRPVCRTHGFAVTALDLLAEMRWHSVDSGSWKQTAGWGGVYVPALSKGRYDFARVPLAVKVSLASPKRGKANLHYQSASPLFKKRIDDYLASAGVPLGRSEVAQVFEDYAPRCRASQGVEPGSGECWLDRKRGLLLRPVEVGVCNSFRQRCRANIHFYKQVALAYRDNLELLYFAGTPLPYPEEYETGARLLSFLDVADENNTYWAEHMRRKG